MTPKSPPPTPDTHSEDLYELYKNAPDNYMLRQTVEPDITPETQDQHTPSLRNLKKHKSNTRFNSLHQQPKPFMEQRRK